MRAELSFFYNSPDVKVLTYFALGRLIFVFEDIPWILAEDDFNTMSPNLIAATKT